ncbi:PPK2 family polyphosphate kinase [Sphingobacterium humi]|uniref:Polyphosphate kinase 2 family protein n=1 Tax=Sphingobacterium humi TaxID=1796905 RepID=A0A6N8KVF6_9SPHI|nr:PPK2 family polyphosphate kinase [Sphingobacterium humi]MVZ61107.1 polyphosphate kinase 2 family protein [Sphingobacterium humi]
MTNYAKTFAAKGNFKIKEHPTDIRDVIDPEFAKTELKKLRKKIAAIQDMMYAHDKYSVLICLQGMDTAGKDSLIREVFKAINVRGVLVESFKTPSEEELQHDYLWRHEIKLPEKGKFTVFNRTHYENVLVTRVHPEYLLNERIPHINDPKNLPKDFWKMRFEQINNFEKRITENGTIVMKFFLNLSKKEQKERLLSRLEEEEKNWKFSPGDLAERKLWDKYMQCYEEAIQNCSKKNAPWYIIPSDSKPVARYLVAQIIYELLVAYKDIKYPEMPPEIEEHKRKYKEQLEAE